MFDELTEDELNHLAQKLLQGVQRYRRNLTLVFKIDPMEVELHAVFVEAANAHLDRRMESQHAG